MFAKTYVKYFEIDARKDGSRGEMGKYEKRHICTCQNSFAIIMEKLDIETHSTRKII